MDPTVIQQVPDQYKEIYQRNWNTIKQSVKKGILKDVYHYPLFSSGDVEIKSRLHVTLMNYSGKIKINVAFGFILRNRITDELRFFHPSNNTLLFDTPRLLINAADYRNLEDDIEKQDAFEYARLQRPSTSWKVEKIICVRFDIFKLTV